MDLFGHINVMSISKKRHVLVMVDDFTRYTWVDFLHTKDEATNIIIDHIKKLEKVSENAVVTIRSENGTEFRNGVLNEFCKNHGITQ